MPVSEISDYERMELEAESALVQSVLKEGLYCEFEDKCIPVSIKNDSDPSVGLDGASYLTLKDGYEVLPSSFMAMIRERLGDGYDDIVDLWLQTYDLT